MDTDTRYWEMRRRGEDSQAQAYAAECAACEAAIDAELATHPLGRLYLEVRALHQEAPSSWRREKLRQVEAALRLWEDCVRVEAGFPSGLPDSWRWQ